MERAVTGTCDVLGGLDVLVNNAGVEITGLLTEIDPADVRTMLYVNVLGTALGLKHGLRAMRPGGAAGDGGSTVNISSVAATIAWPSTAVYSATKSAVEQTPAGRLGEIADMADAVVLLASDAARFITGAGLPVDGGMSM